MRGRKSRIFSGLSRGLIWALRINQATKAACLFMEAVKPVRTVRCQDLSFRFYCPNLITRWRADTFLTKEPDTLAWIDSFEPGSVFFDVGANVGLYTIYAAKRGHRVFAFEPEAQNYFLLNQNVYLNSVSDRVTCLNIGFSNRTELTSLFLQKFEMGAAMNSVGIATDWQRQKFQPIFRQGVLSFRLDDFLGGFGGQFPNYLKIDVDGLEREIIDGASNLLKSPRLKSVQIELNENLESDVELKKVFLERGFSISHREFAPTASDSKFQGIYNYRFNRFAEKNA
jgi:FkbM family methyltransferase